MTVRDPTARMWQEACEMLDRAERLQRAFFQLGREQRLLPTWEPPVDVVENGEELTIIVALPGVSARNVDVRIEGGTLMVQAARSLPAGGAGGVIRRLEIPYGRFERQIRLDGGQLRLDRRELVDGCLVLSFRKLD